jgi:haloacetate dehalogenase
VFAGFALDDVDLAPGVRIRFRTGGSGPPVLLLHGNPLTHVSWHAVAIRLAERFTVVVPDLRGYGDSSSPALAPDHSPFSFRAMAQDQVQLMSRLGHERFFVAGHDRGGRVVHRLCLDSPTSVSRAAVLDIVPTLDMFDSTSREWSLRYWHWSFMAHPPDLPEAMMAAVPARFYIEHKLGISNGRGQFFDPRALAEYVRCFTQKTIRASCEDYRAAATIDLELDRADLHRRIGVPLLVLWGLRSNVAALFDPLALWRARGHDVHGRGLDAGHYLPEEASEEVLEELGSFFAQAGPA